MTKSLTDILKRAAERVVCLEKNQYLIYSYRSGSVLAQLYSTSTMEHHHFDHCIMILNSEVRLQYNNISRRIRRVI